MLPLVGGAQELRTVTRQLPELGKDTLYNCIREGNVTLEARSLLRSLRSECPPEDLACR